jgi:hypothetical protein
VDVANPARNGGRQAGSSAGAVFAPQIWPRLNLLHCQHTYRHKLQPQEVAVIGGLTYVDSKVLILTSYFIPDEARSESSLVRSVLYLPTILPARLRSVVS